MGRCRELVSWLEPEPDVEDVDVYEDNVVDEGGLVAWASA